jgi:lysozyme
MTDRASVLAIAEPQIKADEGFRKNAYPDPLSGGAPWTCGWGQTGPNIGPGTVWTEADAQADFDTRINGLCDSLDDHLSWWISLDAVRAAVMLNMGWNLGLGGLKGFPRMLACAQSGDWQGAHDQMLNSTWAHQVPNRALRLASQMQTGVQSYP